MAGLDDADAYAGPALLRLGEREFGVRAELRGHFEPIDGRYHWYGRVAAHEGLTTLLAGAKSAATIETHDGAAPCELSDPDLWGRYRITGTSTPPFRPGG